MKLTEKKSNIFTPLLKKSGSKQQHSVEISIFTQFYPPDYAATGQLIEELANYLKLHEGINAKVFTGQPAYAFRKGSAPQTELSNGILIRRSRVARIWPQRIRGKAVNGILFCLRSGLHLLKTCWQKNTLLLTTAPPYLPIIGYLANLCFGTPYVCIVYDLYPDVAVELKVIPAKHWIARLWNFVNQRTWKRAKRVIVLSPAMKSRIVAKHPDISDKIAVIHSWADPNWIVPINKQVNWFAHKYNLVDKFTVLYSGNMGRCHDMDTILEAAKLLQNEPIQFVFIGGGAKHQYCTAKVKDLGLSNCLFLPYQDKQTLPYSLTACDLSVVSISRGMEGIVAPSKLYGILAAGCPVTIICEPHSYLSQMVAEASCGEAFNNGDAYGLAKFIRLLARDRNLAKQMGKSGRDYLKSNFTPEIIAQQYSKILDSTV